MKPVIVSSLLAVACLLAWSAPANAGDPAVKCESSKLKEAGKYANCRMKADSKAVKKGEDPDYTKCQEKFGDKWGKAEMKADGACPSNGDEVEVEAAINACMGDIAVALTGCVAAGGVVVNGACWFLGGSGQSCDVACLVVGRVCDLATTRDFVGSGGSTENCEAVATAMGLTLVTVPQVGASVVGGGCVYNPISQGIERVTSPETTCEADLGGNTFPRFCACN